MVRSTNTRLDYARTEANKLGDWITGTLMLLLLHGLVFDCCLLLQRFMVSNPNCINFVLAFPQADLDIPVYMELPTGINPTNVSDDDRCQYILKLNKSLYGLKQAGYNWFKKLCEGLITWDFIQSQVDKCISFQKDCIVLMYVDDCIKLGKDMAIIDAVISFLKGGNENFDLVDQGSID